MNCFERFPRLFFGIFSVINLFWLSTIAKESKFHNINNTCLMTTQVSLSDSIYETREYLGICEDHELTSIPDDFQGIERKHISGLYFKGNMLKSLSLNDFYKFLICEFLDLSENEISEVNTDAFFYMSSLRNLSFRQNKLSEIPSASFEYLNNLENLDLSGNVLIRYAFDNVKFLDKI